MTRDELQEARESLVFKHSRYNRLALILFGLPGIGLLYGGQAGWMSYAGGIFLIAYVITQIGIEIWCETTNRGLRRETERQMRQYDEQLRQT